MSEYPTCPMCGSSDGQGHYKDCPSEAITRLTAEIQEAREILAGTAVVSLPNDYPLARLATETWNTLQRRTTEGLTLIGKVEALTAENERLRAALEYIAKGKLAYPEKHARAALEEKQ